MTTLNLHVGDVGVPFEVTPLEADGTPLDLSNATLFEYRFQKPDGSFFTRTGTWVVVDGEGVVRYYFAADDLDQNGTWGFQLRIEFDDGDVIVYSDTVKIKILSNLPKEV